MRALFHSLIALLVLAAASIGAAAIYLYHSGPALPAGSEEMISAVLEAPLPQLVSGQTGIARSDGVGIWYESVPAQQPSRGAVLLVMGIASDALGWPQAFIDGLVVAGYQVIRYDHRDTGLSDWGSGNDYSLAHMADDAVAVLDALDVGHAHVVGVSMGGMIAQEIALAHPARVTSLALLMSSAHIEDPEVAPISGDVAIALIKVALKYGLVGGERNLIRLHVASRVILRGEASYPVDVRATAEQVLYNLRERRGYNHAASPAHQNAVRRTGSRLQRLGQLNVPTLVMHGKADPFIPLAHGEKLAQAIPAARSLWLDDMGHDLPAALIEPIGSALQTHFERASASPCASAADTANAHAFTQARTSIVAAQGESAAIVLSVTAH
jgi:pimeloyl-ACP methyl ester carboxylesterase